ARAEPAAARAEAYFAKQSTGSLRHVYSMNLHAKAFSGLGRHAAALALAERSLEMARTYAENPEAAVGASVEIARALIGLRRDLGRAAALLDEAGALYAKFPDTFARASREVDALRADLEKR